MYKCTTITTILIKMVMMIIIIIKVVVVNNIITKIIAFIVIVVTIVNSVIIFTLCSIYMTNCVKYRLNLIRTGGHRYPNCCYLMSKRLHESGGKTKAVSIYFFNFVLDTCMYMCHRVE
jgi:hypothetical protein